MATQILNSSGELINPAQDLIPSSYDYIGLTYSGSNITQIVYKSGGASGTTVATLTLAYSGSNLTSITRA